MSGGRAPLCASYTALPATPRRCPRDADPMQPVAYGKARFARRFRPPSFGCWRCPGRPSSTAHARAIAHPATPPPSRPIRATRVSLRLPLDVGTCTPNGPKPGWLVAASFSRRRCVLRVPRFPRAHVRMQSRPAAPSRGRFATARMSGRVGRMRSPPVLRPFVVCGSPRPAPSPWHRARLPTVRHRAGSQARPHAAGEGRGPAPRHGPLRRALHRDGCTLGGLADPGTRLTMPHGTGRHGTAPHGRGDAPLLLAKGGDATLPWPSGIDAVAKWDRRCSQVGSTL